jgi:hypothetical protein
MKTCSAMPPSVHTLLPNEDQVEALSAESVGEVALGLEV